MTAAATTEATVTTVTKLLRTVAKARDGAIQGGYYGTVRPDDQGGAVSLISQLCRNALRFELCETTARDGNHRSPVVRRVVAIEVRHHEVKDLRPDAALPTARSGVVGPGQGERVLAKWQWLGLPPRLIALTTALGQLDHFPAFFKASKLIFGEHFSVLPYDIFL
jgi:hypothetical protein